LADRYRARDGCQQLLCFPRRPRSDGVAERDLVAAHRFESRGDIAHACGRNVAFVWASENAGNIATHPNAVRFRSLSDRTRRIEAMTRALSDICGTHFGDTKLVASIAGSPASVRRSMSATLISVGTIVFSFCSPSRGPTSTMQTRCGSFKTTPSVSRLPASKPNLLRLSCLPDPSFQYI